MSDYFHLGMGGYAKGNNKKKAIQENDRLMKKTIKQARIANKINEQVDEFYNLCQKRNILLEQIERFEKGLFSVKYTDDQKKEMKKVLDGFKASEKRIIKRITNMKIKNPLQLK